MVTDRWWLSVCVYVGPPSLFRQWLSAVIAFAGRWCGFICGSMVATVFIKSSPLVWPAPSITTSAICTVDHDLLLLLCCRLRTGIMDGGTPNFKTWNIIYPVYINSKKTIAEGRRISATKACENPTALEVGDCCGHLKIPFAIEIDKAYPRDYMQVGRVRVLLKRPDGSLHNPLIASKKQLMIRIAELVPRHPGRLKKQESAASSSNAAAPSKSGKGGRKKR
ncbi:hypothetical protein L1987_76635 [Smallanthus sonchifolius]|uniref:Uncharacterized protein n=1 Tax=Smallanthus sonchifolius TaxID=185202 RepID=A0ACB8Z8K2_9ASTR|nr:hypothetical protein L1987_76635 [Smallanthus sonchifolius]